MKIKIKYPEKEVEKSIKKMLDEWDKVKCVQCGKEISMLDCDTIYHGLFFICKNGKCA